MNLPVLIGVTHSQDGTFVAKVPRSVKIAIGKPKGKAIHVYQAKMKDGSVAWILEIGQGKNIQQRPYPLTELDKLKIDYHRLRESSDTPDVRHPEKLPYFTFLRDAGDGTLVHDFEVIEKHGVKPRSVEVVVTDNDPFDAAFEFWTASSLKCRGNGLDAMRSVDFTPTAADKEAAQQARSMGAKYFPIVGGCASAGCPYILPLKKGDKESRQCGPYGRLSLQMLRDIRLGAKAEYATTSYRSITQLSASLSELAAFTGGGDAARGTVRGIPLLLSVAQFKTKHNGIPGTAYAVRLEFRADSMEALRTKISEAAMVYLTQIAPAKREIAPPANKQIAAPAEEPAIEAVAEAAPEGETNDEDETTAVDNTPEGETYRNAMFDIGTDDEFDPDGEIKQEAEERKVDSMLAEEQRLSEGATGGALETDSSDAQPAQPPDSAEEQQRPPQRDLTGSLFAGQAATAKGPSSAYTDPGEQGHNSPPAIGLRRAGRPKF